MGILAVFPSRKWVPDHYSAEMLVEVITEKGTGLDSIESMERIGSLGKNCEHILGYVDKESLKGLISEIPGISEFSSYISSRIFEKAFQKVMELPKLMGIINATPDSFYSGSRFDSEDLKRVDSIIEEKPDIIDIGGESTRPGSLPVPKDEELSRILPIIRHVSESSNIPISVDTVKPEVLESVIQFNVKYANDISGLKNGKIADLAGEHGLRYILMHMRGTPKNMQNLTSYADPVAEIMSFFYAGFEKLVKHGIKPENVIVDPGIGFAKNFDTNLEILRSSKSLNMGLDLLVGMSRKSFLGKMLNNLPEKRLNGTIATSIYLMNHGVDILRLHDISANREALMTYRKIYSDQ